MKKIVYSSLIFFILPFSFAHAYTFNQNLRVGSIGQDVLELQKFLNITTATQIAIEGPGSPGNETSYFGEKTRQAVIKLQNMYAESILKPNGLTQGTGFVGKSTRDFLNIIQNQMDIESNQPTVFNQNIVQGDTSIDNKTATTTASLSKKVPEFFVSKTAVKPDSKIEVGSQHILSDVSFYLDSNKMIQKCFTEYTCRLFIDESTKPGTYKLKSDDDTWGEYKITVLESSTPNPEVSLEKLNLNGDTLIKGKNFSKNMKVYTMFGVFETQTRDNSFILDFPDERVRAATTTISGFFFVENDNGLTSDILFNVRYEI